MLDILIQNATVIDGSGKPAYTGSVGIKDGKLVMQPGNAPASRVIDAAGRVVCPGFIDAHSHGDHILGSQANALFKTAQGITTELCGNCGGSEAPLDPAKQALFQFGKHPWSEKVNWGTFDGFMQWVDKQNLTSNARFYVGHNNLRKMVMGMENRHATAKELDAMKGILRECMEAGAAGFSSGLIYAPSSYSAPEELPALVEVIAPFDGVYTTHMRNESTYLIESVEETIDVARRAGVRADISHHKAVGKPNWGKTKTTLEMIRKANEEGVMVTCDQYPYDRCMTVLSACFSSKHLAAGANLKENLKDPAFRAMLRKEMEDPNSPYDNYYLNSSGWSGVFIADAPRNPEANGRFISEYAEDLGQDPFEVYFDLLMNNPLVWTVYSTMCEEDQCDVIRSPYCVVGTDGCSYTWEEKGHPRASSSFPHAICYYVKEKKILSLEQMIHKMTGVPAQRLNVENKGQLKDGYDADLVIFDYDRLRDTGTFVNAHQKPEGIDYVIVNGEIVYKDMEFTGVYSGKGIRQGGRHD